MASVSNENSFFITILGYLVLNLTKMLFYAFMLLCQGVLMNNTNPTKPDMSGHFYKIAERRG